MPFVHRLLLMPRFVPPFSSAISVEASEPPMISSASV